MWTKDVANGEAVARRVESGAVCVNDAQLNYAALELPMGGWKTSGLGQRHGAAGSASTARQQTILVTRLAPKKDIHMFPYKARTTKLLAAAEAAVRPRQAGLATLAVLSGSARRVWGVADFTAGVQAGGAPARRPAV